MPPSSSVTMGALEDPLPGSELANFYRGKNIFLTGATGFMGKVLIEKLLRKCPDLGKVYVLIRTKKSQLPEQRLASLFDTPLFGRLEEEHPKFRHQVVAVAGDCSLPGLGVSEKDRLTLVNNVHIIFHCAATVRFDEAIDVAVNINVRGTKCILDLAKEMRGLQVVMHVSTAYANCIRNEVDEKLYDVPLHCDRVIQLVEAADAKILESFSRTLIGAWPNSYAFTKAMGENVVKEHRGDLPVGVFRPAIVISTAKEPMPGWIDNLYGPGGVVLGAGSGLLRTLNADSTKVADLVPVDMTVNALIASAWDVANMTSEEGATMEEVPVYTYVSSSQNSITWGDFMRLTSKWGEIMPSGKSVWCYTLKLTHNRALYLFLTLLWHFIPALLVDSVCIAIGNPFRLVKVYKKIFKFSDVIAYFATREWKFRDNRTQALWRRLGPKDQEVFPFDISALDWDEYYRNYIYGMREHMFKEDFSTVPQAVEKHRRFRWAHRTLKTVLALLLLRLCWWLVSMVWQPDELAAEAVFSNDTLVADTSSGRPALLSALRQCLSVSWS